MRSNLTYWEKIDYDFNEKNCIDKIFEKFKQSGFIDCRINAFPINTKHKIDFDIKNKTAASFMMFDLDQNRFQSKEYLDKYLVNVLNGLNRKFNGEANPTVLWTGNGYHIYQPVDGIIFEYEQLFYDFLPYLDGKDLSTEFMRFTEKFFLASKVDPNHSPSINNCMVRVPGTINSKNSQIVELVQKWDGNLPNIRWINRDFFDYLIDKRNAKIKERKSRLCVGNTNRNKKADIWRIEWIERLLSTSLRDHRKYCLFQILVPYLINIKNLSPEESSEMLAIWLLNCSKLRSLDFNPSTEIKNRIKYVRNYKPISLSKLKKTNRELYHQIKLQEIID